MTYVKILFLWLISFAAIAQTVDQYKTTTASGSVNAYTIPNSDFGAYRTNEKWLVDFTGVTTNSGAATLNRNSYGAKSIKMPDGTNPTAGILTGRVQLSYNGTYFYIVGGAGSSGGGTVAHANNGLSLSGDTVQWGGPLTKNTFIEGYKKLDFGDNLPLNQFQVTTGRNDFSTQSFLTIYSDSTSGTTNNYFELSSYYGNKHAGIVAHVSSSADQLEIQQQGNGFINLSTGLSGGSLIERFSADSIGNIKILPNGTTGSNGQFLKTDGTGKVSWATASGGVTSIATTSPITGGTITTTGTIACATCVTSAASLTSNNLVIGGGSQATSTTATGTGVLTALGVNVGSAGAFITNGGALGTPTSGTLTNATGLPPTTGISGWPSNSSGVLSNNGSGTLSWAAAGTLTSVASADGSVTITNPTTTPDLSVVKLNQGIAYTEVGTLLDETFPGSSLSGTNWSGSLPTGASISSKLIIASGASDWSRYIQLVKFFPFEKETFEIYFKAVTKNSGDAWGIHQNLSLLASGNQSIYIKFDQSNGANSGMLSMGSTTAANEYGYSQALSFSAGDQLKLTIIKKPGRSITILENVTSPTTNKAYGDFATDIRTTGGQYRLTFLGGQQEFSEFKVTSNCRNFGGTSGVVFLGDSQTNGAGNSDPVFRYADLLMKSQTNLYEVIGISTWRTTDFTASRVTEFLSGISAKYLVVNTGYNDYQFNPGSPSTYETALETIATTAQGLGYTVIFVTMVPSFSADNSSFDTQMQTAATNTSSAYISVRTALTVSSRLNANYVASDAVHINDAGSLVMANTIAASVPSLYSQLLIDFNNSDVKLKSIPFGKASIPLLGRDHDGRVYLMDPSKYFNKNSPTLFPGTLRAQETGSIGITGSMVIGGPLQLLNATAQGLRLGFNNGANDNNGTNINITNAGNGGVGFPQAYSNITGLRNIDIIAGSSGGSWKTGSDHNISGNDNILIQSNLGGSSSTLSGSGNTMIGVLKVNGFTSANNNIGISTSNAAGPFNGITTGSYNIQISPLIDAGNNATTQTSSTSGTILIGTPWDSFGKLLVAGECVINPYSSGTNQKLFTFGPLGGKAASVVWSAGYMGGTNLTGYTHYLDAPRGTGTGLAGDIRIRFSIPGSSGTTVHSTYNENVILSRTGSSFGSSVTAPSASPTAFIHLAAGTAAASSAPLKFTTGTSLTSAEAGAVEYTTDDLFFTISTGTARKRFLFADATGGLTSGRVPYATTNGRLTDASGFTFDGTNLTVGAATNIVGTTTNNNATAGNIGEDVNSKVAVGSAVSLTTATAANITSISLTAGDWEVEGNVNFTETVATVTSRTASIGTTSATLATDGTEVENGVQSTLVTEKNACTLPKKRISISGTTTVYLVGSATFSAGTCAGYGYIKATRIR